MPFDFAELKVSVGDEVCYTPVYPKNNKPEEWEILTVTKVTTKAGQIVTDDGRRFDRDGFEIGGELTLSGSRASICTLTEELRNMIEHAKNLKFLSEFKWHKLKAKAASEVITVLKLNGAID